MVLFFLNLAFAFIVTQSSTVLELQIFLIFSLYTALIIALYQMIDLYGYIFFDPRSLWILFALILRRYACI